VTATAMRIDDAAAALREATAGRRAIPPLRETMANFDGARAYAVQEANTRHAIASGRRLVGRKIGLTSPVVQAQLGVDQPDYGMLFSDMRIADGGRIPLDRLIQPKIEGEIAFTLAHDLTDPAIDTAAVIAAVGTASAALEIVDSRIADWNIAFIDTVADNASSALFAVADKGVAIGAFDPVACRMTLRANGTVVSEGEGRSCLGSPILSALWLARKMIEVGRPLRAGCVVMTGALGPMVPVAAGTRYDLNISGVGTVSIDA
jgi:2-keto-4-pentenoate hydratase